MTSLGLSSVNRIENCRSAPTRGVHPQVAWEKAENRTKPVGDGHQTGVGRRGRIFDNPERTPHLVNSSRAAPYAYGCRNWIATGAVIIDHGCKRIRDAEHLGMGSRMESASSVHRARGRRRSRADSVAIYGDPIGPLGSLEHGDRHRRRWQTWRFAGPGPPEASSVRSSWMRDDVYPRWPSLGVASVVLTTPMRPSRVRLTARE